MTRSSFVSVLLAVAARRLRLFATNRAISIPYFAMPLLFLAFGGGGLHNLGAAPAFDFPAGYTTFYFVYVLLQGAAFAGTGTGAAIAADFESGFARRFLLVAPHRISIVAGYILSAAILSLFLMLFLTLVGLGVGVKLDGSLSELAGLYALAILLTIISALWTAGFALRVRLSRAQTSATMPIFLTLMLSPAFVPRPLLSSWMRFAADHNPYTAILEAARGLISGRPDETAFGFIVAAGVAVVFLAWAMTGLRQALRSA